jgi:hypothetical protein
MAARSPEQYGYLEKMGWIRTAKKKNNLYIGYIPWRVEVTYIWKQTFPPKANTHISHSYMPIVALGSGASFRLMMTVISFLTLQE